MSKKITNRKFSELVKEMALSEDQLRRAKQVLVDGLSVAEVAEREGVTEKTIRVDCRRIVGKLRQPVRLSEDQFNLAVSRLTRMSERNIELAKRVLVDGETLVSVSEEADIAPPTLSGVIRRIKEKVVPKGWRMVSVLLPGDIADKVERMATDEAKRLENEQGN